MRREMWIKKKLRDRRDEKTIGEYVARAKLHTETVMLWIYTTHQAQGFCYDEVKHYLCLSCRNKGRPYQVD